VLIRPNDLLTEVAKRREELAHGTLQQPPADFAAFMRAVGRYAELQELDVIIRELARKADE
jgi:hypothetical protein